MAEKPIEERVSILEEKVFNQGKQDDETVVLVKDLSRKLVEHIEVEGKRDLRNDMKVDNIEAVVSETKQDIKILTSMATTSKEELIAYRATIKTVAKIISIIILLISAAWAVLPYVDKSITIKVEKKL